MNIIEAIVLGAVQGLTEFIPVSSSGHLVLVRELFGINNAQGLAFDAVLHLSTSFAVLVYFWPEIKILFQTALLWLKDKNGSDEEIEKENLNLLKALILGTIPVVIVAFFFEGFITGDLRSPLVVAAALIAGSIIFWLAEQTGDGRRRLTPKRGLLAGSAQIIALIPGISRSGITIAGGLFAGLNREMATKFSFLLAFPIVFGAGLKKLLDLGFNGLLEELGLTIIVGSFAAFIFGYISIKYMLHYLKNHSLTIFVVYRIILAAVVIIAVL